MSVTSMTTGSGKSIMAEQTNKWQKSPPELIHRFQSIVSILPGVDMRKMFGYPCSFIDDKMFTGLHQYNWVLRLEEQDRQIMQQDFDAGVFEPMPGRVMREYVALPQSIIEDDTALNLWLQKSLQFVKLLPPKQQKKKKD